MENSKQPAYPFEWEHCKDGKVYEFGLTKRELIAAMAMQGLLSNSHETDSPVNMDKLANVAVMQADKLLEQLTKG